ncbi:MAG: hypothetical protein CL902_01760 [Dehalococcoidia bacterium]|nr:hypothetical protein [Dehalococcoidia bacterium]
MPSGFTISSGGTTAIGGDGTSFDGTESVSISGQVITITRSGGSSLNAGTAVTLELTNIKNSTTAGSTGTYSIKTTNSSDVTIDQDTAVAADSLVIGTLTSTNVQPESLTAGNVGDIDITFTLASDLAADGKIVITLPSGFTVSSEGTTAIGGDGTSFDGTETVSVSGQVITITRSGGTALSAGTAVTIELTKIKNPTSSGTTGNYGIKTTNSSGATINEDSSIAGDTITAAAASGTLQVAATADLSLTHSSPTGNLLVGGTQTYTYTVTNKGSGDASGANFTNTLPSGTTLSSISTSRGSCVTSPSITCTFGTLGTSHTATVTVVVKIDKSGTLVNTGKVSADQQDPVSSNNTVSVTNTALEPITASLTYEPDGNVRAGETVVIKVTFTRSPDGTPSIAIDTPGVDLDSVKMTSSTDGKVWTYSYVVPEGSDGTATVSVGGLNSESGSDNVELTNNTFDINSKGASVALTYSPDENILAGETVVITATFNPEITGTPTISIDTTGTDLSAVAMTKSADGKVWTYSYSPPPNSDGEATVTIAGGLDKSGNQNQKATNNTFLIGPKEIEAKLTYSPEEGIVPGTSIVITATFDVTFKGTPSISIATPGPDQGPFVMTSSADGKVWTLTYVVPEGSEGLANVSISGLTEGSSKQILNLSNNTFQIDADNADLSVGVAANNIGVVRRGELTYTATVVNRGPMTATGVRLVNDLPAEAIFESYGPQSLDCNLGTLEPVEGVVVSIDITVGGDAEDQLVNRATVSGAKTDPVDENNEGTAITDVIVGVLTYVVSIQEGEIDNTGIILTDFPDPVFLGSDLTYDLDVRNGGPNPVTESRLIVSLPSSVVFASAVVDFGAGSNSSKLLPNGSYDLTKAIPKVASLLFSSSNGPAEMVGECTEGSGTVICTLGELQPGQEARVTIVVEPEAPGVLINQAKLVQEGLDPDSAVMAADESTTVKMMSDLSISIQDVSSSVLHGEEFTFDFVVSNAGPSPATGVSLSNEIP